MLYQRRKPKREEEEKSVTSCTIHSLNIYITFIYFITQHTHIHTHTQKANDIKLTLFIRSFVCLFAFFVTRNSNQTVIYHHFIHHLLVKYTKQSICFFAPSTLFISYTYTILLYLLHFFICQMYECGCVRALANMYRQRYNSTDRSLILLIFVSKSFD